MNYFWLDANAIVKQYVTETGTPLINDLFTRVPLNRMFCLFDSMDEACFAFVRKRNDGIITVVKFNQAIQQFKAEVINRADVKKMDATQNQKIAARQFIDAYSVYHTDAYILQCALDEADKLRTAGADLTLVSSDKHLLAAAKRKRLLTFDPETDSQIYLDNLINS